MLQATTGLSGLLFHLPTARVAIFGRADGGLWTEWSAATYRLSPVPPVPRSSLGSWRSYRLTSKETVGFRQRSALWGLGFTAFTRACAR